jgi:hypothetical protein
MALRSGAVFGLGCRFRLEATTTVGATRIDLGIAVFFPRFLPHGDDAEWLSEQIKQAKLGKRPVTRLKDPGF